MANGQSITGRKVHNQFDFYETPEDATNKILRQLITDGVLNPQADTLYEPCCGAGAITKVFEQIGFKYQASDIQDADYIIGEKDKDVYKLPDKCCDTVFTNPPYDLMTDENMLAEFLRISRGKVILLLNVFFLSSSKRKEMLQNSPLKYIYMHSDRVTMFPYGEEKPKNGGTKMFCWYVWENGYEGEPIVRWL